MISTLIFLGALGLLVFIHEWGHFIVAKKCGIRVDIFSIGFGPKILGFKWHGTEYRVAPLPLGGYVKIYGQEPLEEAEGDLALAEKIATAPDSFTAKKVWQKMAVVLAGPVMNIVLCWFLLPFVFMAGRLEPKILNESPVVMGVVSESPASSLGIKAGDVITHLAGKSVPTWREASLQMALHPEQEIEIRWTSAQGERAERVRLAERALNGQAVGFLGVEPTEFYGNEPVVDGVLADMPAGEAGVKSGDRILKINDTPIQFWTQMTDLVMKSRGQALKFSIERAGQVIETTITPTGSQEDGWRVGLSKSPAPDLLAKKTYSFSEAFVLGQKEFAHLCGLTADVLKKLFTAQLSAKSLGGPLQIAKATSSAAESGLGDFLYLLAFLSLQLGVMNLLPIPVLDGGHLTFMTIEVIIRRRLPHRLRMILMQIGMVLLLGMMVYVTINDVNHIWGWKAMAQKVVAFFH